MPAETNLFRCLNDNYGVLIHDPATGATQATIAVGEQPGRDVPADALHAPGGGGKVPINPGYILYHDNEKIVIRNYEGKIFEYPETANGNVQFAPQREYHDEYLYS